MSAKAEPVSLAAALHEFVADARSCPPAVAEMLRAAVLHVPSPRDRTRCGGCGFRYTPKVTVCPMAARARAELKRVPEPSRPDSVGSRVARLRRRRGMTQVVLADLVGRSEAWVRAIENGRREADRLSVIRELAQALGVSVLELIGEDTATAAPASAASAGGARS